jgi:hypothetical protein
MSLSGMGRNAEQMQMKLQVGEQRSEEEPHEELLTMKRGARAATRAVLNRPIDTHERRLKQ